MLYPVELQAQPVIRLAEEKFSDTRLAWSKPRAARKRFEIV
jgi:hypothetical protein